MSNWAEKYMKKQGWKVIGGIGKTLQDRSEPVKECFEYSNVLKVTSDLFLSIKIGLES